MIAGLTEFDTMSRDYISGSGSLTPEKVGGDPTLFAAVREACHRNIYLFANTSLMNGLSSETTVTAAMAWYQTAMICVTSVVGACALASFVLMILARNKQKKEETGGRCDNA